MAAAIDTKDQRTFGRELLKRGVALLSQQIWCWGRDILRPEGNFLLEIGFDRIKAPADRGKCTSVYTLEFPEGRRVVLRGFGVFYGDDRLGGVFLPRYEFRPRCTSESELKCPPWSDSDLPNLTAPDESRLETCVSLTVDLIDWLATYESRVAERLGAEYRQSTLDAWKVTRQPVLPATEMATAWRSLGGELADHPQALLLPG